MYKKKKIIALITARGNSKGLPGKNIKDLLGKPLIAHTILEALASKYLDSVLVSTDDKEILKISKKYGATASFIRPARLATDKAKIISVVLHALRRLEENNKKFDLIMLLQPTSPLRTTLDIDKSIELLFARKARMVVSLCEVEHHPYCANVLPEDGCMKNFLKPKIINKNRQEFPTFYRLNGAIYLAYCDDIKRNKSFFGHKTYAYIMPKDRSIDIDDRMDFKIAEALLKEKN